MRATNYPVHAVCRRVCSGGGFDGGVRVGSGVERGRVSVVAVANLCRVVTCCGAVQPTCAHTTGQPLLTLYKHRHGSRLTNCAHTVVLSALPQALGQTTLRHRHQGLTPASTTRAVLTVITRTVNTMRRFLASQKLRSVHVKMARRNSMLCSLLECLQHTIPIGLKHLVWACHRTTAA